MKKVLLASFGRDATLALSQVISKKYDWQIVYITIDRTDVDFCMKEFPGVIVHSIQDLRCGIPPKQWQIEKRFVFDKASLGFIKLYEQVFYSMADRMDKNGFQFSFAQRRRHLFDVVGYWLTVMKELDIALVVSRNIPHFPGEYGMYIASQLLSRPFLMADSMATLNRSWVISSIENRSDRLINSIEKSSDRIVSSQVKLLVEKLTNTYSNAVPDYFKKNRGNAKQEEKRWFSSFYIRMLVGYLIRPLISFQLSEMTLKVNRKPLLSSKSRPLMIQNIMVKLNARNRIKKNRKLYEKNCCEFRADHPYVYFAPNYQPERSTYPDADIFGDTLLILDIISSSIPDDWVIYYKEHPSIFSLPNQYVFWRGHMYRDKEFYDRVVSYSNVKLIHHETDSFSLIDNAKCTATATGTVALESAVRGTPALIFGSVWFDNAEGVTRYFQKNDIQNLIKKIESGYRPDENRLLKYLQSAWDFSSEKYPNLLRNDRSPSEFITFRNRIEKMLTDYSQCFEKVKS